MGKALTKLMEEGPLTSAELGCDVHVIDRSRGVTIFNPGRSKVRAGEGPHGKAKTGILRGVYYVDGHHSERQVLKKWAEVNYIEELNKTQLIFLASQFGSKWKEAAQIVFLHR